jgi:hypothetical protein
MVMLQHNLRVGDRIRVRGPRDWEITKIAWIAGNGLTLCDSQGRYHNTLEVAKISTAFSRQLAFLHFIDRSTLGVLISSIRFELNATGDYDLFYRTPLGEEKSAPRDTIRSITFGDGDQP